MTKRKDLNMDTRINDNGKRVSRKDTIEQILQSSDIKANAERLMQKQFGNVPLWIDQKCQEYNLNVDKLKGITQSEFELSLIGCFVPEQLMYMFGAWNDYDVDMFKCIHNKIKYKRNEQSREIVKLILKKIKFPANAPQRLPMPVVLLSIELQDVLKFASEEGASFSHNESILKSFYDLKKNLELYSLLNLNPQNRGYTFEDGTPPVYDWSANKLWNETEYSILYNTIMSLNHCELPKQSLSKVLANRLVETRIMKSLQEIERHSFPYASRNPERFLQINQTCALMKKKLRFNDMLSLQMRYFVTHNLIQEARKIFQVRYPDDKEIILGWYDESTKNIVAKLPEELAKLKLKIKQNNVQKKNEINTVKGKERNE